MNARIDGTPQGLEGANDVLPVMHRLLLLPVSPVDIPVDATQLSLLTASAWELDDSTRQVGRAGIAAARAALAAARPYQNQ
ncbi:MAG TPA: hypothetical protein VM124_00340 [Candidatus Limnocylindrales bacterium]|nr:hypothetical protein [Candidatus Limnocylindrales bacterium]